MSEEFKNLSQIKLEPYQESIYEGLKHIGDEIATLYLDGVRIFKSNIPSKSYLLAHIAREIEGGIRDIFVPQEKKYEICKECGNEIKKSKHIDEICEILGVKRESEFVKEWHKIAKQFHKYAHRHGVYKIPRDKEEFDELWKKFEKYILYKIIGQYLGLIRLIDRVLSSGMPTQEMIESTKNMLKNQSIANYFFKKVSELKWFYPLKEAGYFSPEKVPGPQPADKEGYFRIPYWSPLYYLEKISEQIKENKITGEEKTKYARQLLEIIKNISTYKDQAGNHIDNYHVWSSFVRILSNLPNDLIDKDIIDLIPVWLDSEFLNDLQAKEIIRNLLPKFLTDNSEDIEKAERIIHHLTEIKVVKKDEKEEKVLKVNSYHLKELFMKYSEKIGQKCTIQIIENLKKKIKSLIKNETEGTYYSFYIDQDYLFDQPVELLSYGLRKIMLFKAEKEPEKLKNILSNFLKDRNFIFPKIALYIIAENMDKFSKLWWKVIEADIGVKIFKNTLFWGDELKHVLENIGTLNEEQRKILEEKINTACSELKKEREKDIQNPEEIEKIISLHKQKIYKALSHDKHFKNLYKKIKDITKTDVELGPAIGKVEAKWGWGKSPLSENEILTISNEELSKYLTKFKTKDFWKGPTIEALAEALKNAAKINAEKFTQDLRPFKNTGYLYIYKLLYGFSEALKENKPVSLEKIFDFLLDYIDREEFWKDKLIVHAEISELKATHEWVISSVASLIIEIIQNKSSGISIKLLDTMEKVILVILKKLEYRTTQEVNDYVNYSLNTPLGRILESYIKLILQKEKNLISQQKLLKFKNNYEKILNNNFIEAYTWFGFYFAWFYHHLKEWTKEKVNFLNKMKNTPQWEAFMTGYLFANRVYKEIYELLKEHYKFGINYNFKNEEAIRGLIAHISIAYLYGKESLNPPSLFFEIVKDLNPNYIKKIINFFWQIEKDEEKIDNFREKILDFWKYVFEKLKDKMDNNLLTNQDTVILSELSKLTIFLPYITEEYKEWLALSAMYAEKNHNASFFIEYLDNLKDKGNENESAKYVGEIFLKLVENCDMPHIYPERHIKSIVEFLFNVPKAEEYAKRICNLYAKKNILFLREIYERYEST